MTTPSAAASSAGALFEAAGALLAEGRDAEAMACLRRLCDEAPECAEARINLGFLLSRNGAGAAAESCFRQAIALGATQAALYLNYGALLARAMRVPEAEAIYRQGLHANPASAPLWSNLGVLHAYRGQDAHAEHCLREALRLAPEHAGARYNLGYLQLCRGSLREGFANFEARNWYAWLGRALGGLPRWGGEALAGRRILIACEAGHGDMIQFCRYASDVRSRGAGRIGLLCHPALARLFETLAGVDQILPLDQPLDPAAWDCWVPPLSLPHLCGTDAGKVPAPIPYLHASPADIARWQARLPAGGLRVGLAWRGNPAFENDARRSLPGLATLAPLWSVAGASFVSLQKGPGEADVAALARCCPLTGAGPHLADFADTAAVIAQLDLVVSVDTAVAHLAGALGIPCWLLLPAYATDWRWQRGRSDCDWYPGRMRLFRQLHDGDWQAPVAALSAALRRLVAATGHAPGSAITHTYAL